MNYEKVVLSVPPKGCEKSCESVFEIITGSRESSRRTPAAVLRN